MREQSARLVEEFKLNAERPEDLTNNDEQRAGYDIQNEDAEALDYDRQRDDDRRTDDESEGQLPELSTGKTDKRSERAATPLSTHGITSRTNDPKPPKTQNAPKGQRCVASLRKMPMKIVARKTVFAIRISKWRTDMAAVEGTAMPCKLMAL